MVGIVVGIGVVTLLRDAMAYPWYVPTGSLVTFVVGWLVGGVLPRLPKPSPAS